MTRKLDRYYAYHAYIILTFAVDVSHSTALRTEVADLDDGSVAPLDREKIRRPRGNVQRHRGSL